MADGVAQTEARRVAKPRTESRPEALLRLTPNLRWQVTQAAADLLTVFAAAMANYGFYLLSGVGQSHYEPVAYLQLNFLFAVVTVFALHGYGAYRDDLGLLRIEAVRKILRAVFAGLLLSLALSFLIKYFAISRATLIMLGPVSILALVAQRFLLWKIRDRARAALVGVTKVLIYGAGHTGRLLAQNLLGEQQLELMPVGFLDDDSGLWDNQVKVGPGVDGIHLPVLGGQEAISAVVKNNNAGAVFIAMPSAPPQRISQIISLLEERGIPFFFVPSASDLVLSSLRLRRVAGIPVFAKRSQEVSRLYLATKRGLDFLGSLGLLVVLGPLLAGAAALVKLTSPGPVLFRQTRVGLNGCEFTIFKLRTMHRDAPKYALHPQSGEDVRLTGVGRWLRRLSIDELPQLFNVLRGEMSLVGPRPEMPFVVDRYDKLQRLRLLAPPGITGLWQISADRAFVIHDNLHYDLYYVEHRSPSLDLAIMLITPFVLVMRKRAT